MAYDKRRIPRADSELNTYIRNTTSILLAPGPPHNWERLGLTEEQKDGWSALHNEWVAVYARCIAPGIRDSNAIADRNALRLRFTKFTQDILSYMKNRPGITAGEREVFRVWKDKKTKTRRSAIADAPQSVLQTTTGARIRLRARVASSEGRPRIHPMADCLDIRYSTLPIGAEPPQTWEQCTENTQSTKAIATLKLAAGHRGKVMYAFCRWMNICEKEKSGPWSSRMEAIVA